MNPGGGGCGEPRSRHCTPAWVTRAKLHLKKKEAYKVYEKVQCSREKVLHDTLPVNSYKDSQNKMQNCIQIGKDQDEKRKRDDTISN